MGHYFSATAYTVKQFTTLFFALTILALSALPANAAILHDYTLDWFTLESKHFRCHFHNGEEKLARRTLAIAEEVHTELSLMMDWEPDNKTDIILTDEFDVSNGYATPFPTNRTGIFLSGPDSVNSIEDNSDWLETVIKHEYLHILHLDKAIGAASVMRKIFGRAAYIFPFFTAFPNAYQPSWLIEGLATYVETDKERGVGRGQSSYFDMLMRMEVKDGFKTLRHVNVPQVTEWPLNTSRYLYGVHFFQYIEEKYGKQKITELVDSYSDNVIPWRVNSNAYYTVGKDMWGLWDEFETAMKAKYQPQWEAVNKRGEIIGEQLTRNGYFTGPLQVSDRGEIYYIDYNADKNMALKVLRPNKGSGYQRAENITKVKTATKIITQPEKTPEYKEAEEIADIRLSARFDLHDKAGIILAKPELCRNAALYFDLYHIDPASGDETRLTNCARYRTVTWNTDGTKLMAVKNGLAKNELHLLTAKGEYLQTLWKGKYAEVIASIDWSPVEDKLIASVFRPETGWNLEQFDIATKQWTFITKDSAIETNPLFSRDGKNILYSSDNGGIYNIRRLNLETGHTSSLTDLIGGGFYPVQGNAENELYYVGYSKEGYDVFKLAVKETRKVPVAKQGTTAVAKKSPISVAVVKGTDTGVEMSPVKEYSAFESVIPRWYHPLLAIGSDYYQIGAFTYSWDTLARHIYGVSLSYANYDSSYDDWLGSFDYIYDRWPVTLKLHTSHRNRLFLDNNDNLVRVRGNNVQQAEAVFPLLSLSDRLSFHVAAIKDTEKDAWRKNSSITTRASSVDNLLGAAIVYQNASIHPKSVSRAEGRSIQLVAEDSDAIGNSDYTGKVYSIDWREFIRLGGSHVLALRAVEGRGTDNPRAFQLGGSNNTNFEPGLLSSTLISSPFNRREYLLRGYDEGHAELTNRRMRLMSVEYRFPVWRLERSAMIPPIGLQQLSAAVFVDRGATWRDGSPDKYYTGSGVELYADTIFGYSTVVRITLGYAHGHDSRLGKDNVYLRLGASF